MSRATRAIARAARAGRGPLRWPVWVALAAAATLLAPAAAQDASRAARDAARRWAWTRDPATPWVLNATGPRRQPPVDLVVFIDESGSTGASDPGGARWHQTEELVAFFERSDHGDAISVGRFASTADTIPAPAEPSEVDVEAARAGGDVGHDTAFVPVSEQLNRVLGQDRAGRRRVAVLLTDGAGPDVSEALDLLDSGIELWVLGLDHDGTWSSHRPDWEPRARSASIEGDAEAIAGAQAAVLGELTGQDIQVQQQPPPEAPLR